MLKLYQRFQKFRISFLSLKVGVTPAALQAETEFQTLKHFWEKNPKPASLIFPCI